MSEPRRDAAIAELLAELDGALSAPPAPPSAGLRGRLLGALRSPSRFAPFVAPLASLFDVPESRARELLTKVDDPGAWTPVMPGIALQRVDGGPATAGAAVGLMRVQPGVTFPRHPHPGPERLLMLEGGCHDSGGFSLWPGDEITHATGTEHDFIAAEGRPFVFAVVAVGQRFPRPRR